MISQDEIKEIKKTIEELLQKMTIADFKLEASIEKNDKENTVGNIEDVIVINLNLKEPQFLIGQNGQTLFELQRILRVILNKKIKKSFYLKLDINDYQKQKTEYLKNLAKSMADEAVLTKEKKSFSPMPSYERRVVHEELAKRQDVVTESQGEGDQRYIVVSPK